MIRRFTAALALLCLAVPALGQSTYVTPSGTRVQGVVALQCDTNGTNCAPNGSTGTVAPQVQGNVASGVADTGNPVKIGGRVTTSPGTASDGNRVDALFNVFGGLYTFNTLASSSTDGFGNTAMGVQASPGGVITIPLFAGYNFNGTTWDRQRGDVNGTVVQHALSATYWNFAPAVGGIVNTTTAVTVKAAAGASVRNYIESMQCNSDALGAATELALRDGAAGTVLYRQKIATSGWLTPVDINFDPPLKGTANTLVEIVTLTASVTGGVYCNLQGYTGT